MSTEYREVTDTMDDPAAQAERDSLMLLACSLCGGEVPGPGSTAPDHLDSCPEARP